MTETDEAREDAMTESTQQAAVDLDFALAAYLDDGEWTVTPIPVREDDAGLTAILTSMRRFPGEAGVLGLVSVDDDFFVIARLSAGSTRLLLSDASAAVEYPLAHQVLDELGIPVGDDDDDADSEPAGDLGIVADLGISAMEMGALCDEAEEDFPDDVLTEIAERLGFGETFSDVVEASTD